MKTAYYLIAALTLATAGAAFGAEDSTATTTAAAAATATAASVVTAQQAPKSRGLTRAQVQAQVIEARKNGTLIETEADMDVAQTRKHYAQ